MENTTESRETFAASNPTPQGQDGSSLNAAFDVDAFVHASGDGFGNTAPLRSDTGAIDMDAISQVAHVTQGAGKLTRKEKKHAKREMKRRKKEAKKAEKEAKKTYSSIKSQLKDRDKELSDKMADARKKRDSAKDVVNYIGYNKMYQDGICEVEEGMFSSSIAFDDTSYHSVRDEQQKAMFSAITRLYDQFGADTLVQMSIINTPLLKEEVGHRKFFDPERQANDAARNDAQVFNNILNDKVKEGVSNIRRNRYLTYSVTADTAEDAARQLSRIEVESSRILNSIGSKAHLMNGTQRLSVIHSLLNPYKPFLFDYQRDISAKRLQTTKDCIAPTQIDFRPDGHYNDCVKLDNGVYAQVLVMKKFGSELSDRALADMADLPIPMAITWYVQPMDKSKAINYVRTRSAWIDKEIIEEQRSAVNKGYDFSILPQELKYSKEETEDVLDHLQNKNQRLYVFTGLVYTYAESKEALDTQVLRIISTARQNSIELDSYMKYRCEHLYKQSNYTRVPNYQKAIDTNNSELFLRALGEGGYYTASQDSYIAQYRSICQSYPLVAKLDSMTAEEFKNRYSGTTLIPGGGQDYQSADQWQKDIVNACSQTPWPGANLCATWTTRVYARAGHPVGGNGNTQLGNQGYGANYSQKRATTDLSQIKVGMLISAQYGSNTAAGNAYGHVGIYIGDGKVMDSIYSGLRTISLSDWVSQNGRGWVVCGYPWDWR